MAWGVLSSLRKRYLKGDLIIFMHCLENTEKSVGLIWGVHSERTRETDHKVYKGKFLWNKKMGTSEQTKQNLKG